MHKSETGKEFNIGQLISVATGTLVVPSMSVMLELLNHMVKEPVEDVAAGRVCREVRPALFEQHPWLREIDLVRLGLNEKNWQRIIDGLAQRYGNTHRVYPIHQEDHEQIDPLEDARRQLD